MIYYNHTKGNNNKGHRPGGKKMEVKEFRKYAEAAQYLKEIKNSGFRAFLQEFYDEKGIFYHVAIYDI